MRKALLTPSFALLVAAMFLAIPLNSSAQNREKFVISARAGGVNAVTGRASMRHGNTEWQQLTIKEDLEAGDVVKTGLDGRVEMLLNPGSYLRMGENSELELSDNSLENLEVRLIRGTAIAYGVPIITTLTGAMAAVQGIRSLRQKPLRVRSLQTHHAVT